MVEKELLFALTPKMLEAPGVRTSASNVFCLKAEYFFGPCLQLLGSNELVPGLQSQHEVSLLVSGGLGLLPREFVKSFFALSISLEGQCCDATLGLLEWKDIEPVKHCIFGTPLHPPTALDIVDLLGR